MQIRLATEEDVPHILALMQANKRENLTEQEQRTRGFVQGSMKEPAIIERIHALGIDIATEGDRLVGAALTTQIVEGDMPGLLGPALKVADTELTVGQFYFYGPAVVDTDFRGRHVLTRILDAQFARMSTRFSQVAAFAEEANQVSVAVHVKLGFVGIGQFEFKGRTYRLLRRDLPVNSSAGLPVQNKALRDS